MITYKKILVIDDIREFEGAVHAKSSKIGIEMLKSKYWDEVWLDHDLGENDTIKPVVEYLEWGSELIGYQTPDLPEIKFISANPTIDSLILGLRNSGYMVNVFWNAENLPLRRN